MYGNPYNQQMYINDLQNMKERIDRQMQQIQQPIQPNNQSGITQNFQLAPSQNNTSIKYLEDIEDVKKELVFNDTLFINKGHTLLWYKNASGEIKTYSLNEIIELDEKDLKIAELESRIKEMENNAKYDYANVDESITKQKSSNVSNDKSSKK